ncbi:hypothetical protein PUN28_005244 [Cardiocondyla obscurior]|uniref:Uncharacterized protein n=1 Tax=Cardiocondyla obscurior TaxID=286306 RepID=A0AAW2GGS0_9HYME
MHERARFLDPEGSSDQRANIDRVYIKYFNIGGNKRIFNIRDLEMYQHDMARSTLLDISSHIRENYSSRFYKISIEFTYLHALHILMRLQIYLCIKIQTHR